ncbi:SDR family oxidoreductase [Polynucleobacter paneuropaeus]|jgi:UDP-glucose 4-epimerase|uniref:NAD-dependent epimerase/dehydratase family protein n=1 Tax=Polynucleobacter paneuropaeus TaxID=2527775 RepID=UPI001BFCFA61|nr:SDR family oxidoreductase [Polynucleobacter paneuropaeus]MBT8633215.1 SDR family oxidoreductase [Polynucleobacter paneuropaeus]
MRILITGGFGFLGGRLGQYFHKRGFEVILGSRIKRTAPAWLPGAGVVLMKWNEAEELYNVCHGIDIVLHCAGMNAKDCAAAPIDALEFNGLATERLASAAANSGVHTFIYFSTAHIYSRTLSENITEEMNPINDHPYATSHLYGERAALASNQASEMRVIVMRLSNIVGAPADKSVDCWTLVANDLCRQAIEKGKLELRTSGKQLRNFMGISQLLSVVEHLITHVQDNKFEVFNVGSNHSSSISELAQLIQARFKKIFDISLQLFIPDDHKNEVFYNFNYKVDRLLSTKPRFNTSLEDDIDELLIFCKKMFTARN